MKKLTLLFAVMLFCVPSAAQAEKMDVTADVTYASKYLFRGIDIYDDTSAWQPSVTIDLGSGFYGKVWMSYPGSGGEFNAEYLANNAARSRVNATEYRYIGGYKTVLFEGEDLKTNVDISYTYYDFIDMPTKVSDSMEVGAFFDMPYVLGGDIVPHFYSGRIWQAKSDSALPTLVGGNFGGWVHLMGVSYGFDVGTPDEALPMVFTSNLVYNDGYYGVDHDWSHATFGLATEMDLAGFDFKPGLYWQQSFEKSANTENELYTVISLTKSF